MLYREKNMYQEIKENKNSVGRNSTFFDLGIMEEDMRTNNLKKVGKIRGQFPKREENSYKGGEYEAKKSAVLYPCSRAGGRFVNATQLRVRRIFRKRRNND
jgi:hypothetical protein